jgi:hypothetical protein
MTLSEPDAAAQRHLCNHATILAAQLWLATGPGEGSFAAPRALGIEAVPLNVGGYEWRRLRRRADQM